MNRDNVKFPKMKFKGMQHRSMIRNPIGEDEKIEDPIAPAAPGVAPDTIGPTAIERMAKQFDEEQRKAKAATRTETKANPQKPTTEPEYSIIHRGDFDLQDFAMGENFTRKPSARPKELVVKVLLPLCRSAKGVDLEISEQRLQLKCEKPGPYELDIRLPYPVNEAEGSAKFDKTERALIVTLPVLPPLPPSKLVVASDCCDVDDSADPDAWVEVDIDADGPTSATTTETLVNEVVPKHFGASTPNIADHSSPEVEELPKLLTLGSDSDAWVEVEPASITNAIADVQIMKFEHSQTLEAVTLNIPLGCAGPHDVTLELEARSFGPITTHSVVVRFATANTALHLVFDAALDPQECSTKVTNDAVTVVLGKDLPATWYRLQAGTIPGKLEERLFEAYVGSGIKYAEAETERITDHVISVAEKPAVADALSGESNGIPTASVVTRNSETFQVEINPSDMPKDVSDNGLPGLRNAFDKGWDSGVGVDDKCNELPRNDPAAITAMIARGGGSEKAAFDGDTGGPAAELPFIAAEKFEGSRRGYIFQWGPRGLGYYPDSASGQHVTPDVAGPSAADTSGGNDGGYGGLETARLNKYQAAEIEQQASKTREKAESGEIPPPNLKPVPGINPKEPVIVLRNTLLDELE